MKIAGYYWEMPLHALNYARFGLDKLDFAPFGRRALKGRRV